MGALKQKLISDGYYDQQMHEEEEKLRIKEREFESKLTDTRDVIDECKALVNNAEKDLREDFRDANISDLLELVDERIKPHYDYSDMVFDEHAETVILTNDDDFYHDNQETDDGIDYSVPVRDTIGLVDIKLDGDDLIIEHYWLDADDVELGRYDMTSELINSGLKDWKLPALASKLKLIKMWR